MDNLPQGEFCPVLVLKVARHFLAAGLLKESFAAHFGCFVWSCKWLWCQAAHWGLFQWSVLPLEDEDGAVLAGAVSGCHTGVTDTQVWRQSLVQALSCALWPW